VTGWVPRACVLDLIGRYDVFLVDQFGTLRDETRVYPGAVEALLRLRASGARVVILSNSGRRAAVNAARMLDYGIPGDAYDLLVTSGELGWRLLAEDRAPVGRGARRCLILERTGHGSLLHGLRIAPVADGARADLVIIAGSDGDRRPLEFYASLLRPAASAGVPALCLNPDRTMLSPVGQVFGAGRIAELYQELGGTVAWIGKPYRDIYDFVLAALGDVDRARVAGVGDSIEHDVAGAQRAGLHGWLVRTGIAEGLDDAALRVEAARVEAQPDGVLERFGQAAAP
jgi:HAD superfamily hydrolase (TIGR01459 family)